MSRLAALLSLVVPGFGQLALGRGVAGLLLLFLAGWVHLTLSGLAWFAGPAADIPRAALLGLAGFPPGHPDPLVVVLTVLGAALHLGAAWDALRPTALAPVDGPENANR